MSNQDNKNKTVEEIAREAMDAIKESNQRHDKIDEENLKKALLNEQMLKDEVNRKIKKKLKHLNDEEEKVIKKENEEKLRFLVNWKCLDKQGIKYEGEYNDKLSFKINRGIYLYHLHIQDKELINENWRINAHTSVNLDTLKEKADKLIKQFIKNKK